MAGLPSEEQSTGTLSGGDSDSEDKEDAKTEGDGEEKKEEEDEEEEEENFSDASEHLELEAGRNGSPTSNDFVMLPPLVSLSFFFLVCVLMCVFTNKLNLMGGGWRGGRGGLARNQKIEPLSCVPYCAVL
jgi:hypothetical protein